MAKEIIDNLKEGKGILESAHEYVHANIDISMGNLLIEILAVQIVMVGLLVYIAFFKKHH